MELKITIQNKNEIEKILLIMSLGILDSLEQEAITFQQAFRLFLRPYIAQYLEKHESEEEVVDFFNNICMLEDIAKLMPEKLSISINSSRNEALKLLRNIPLDDDLERYWINDFDN